MKNKWIKGIAMLCAMVLFAESFSAMGPIKVQAANENYKDYPGMSNVFLDAGGYKTVPYGTVTADYSNTYKERADVLPKLENTYLTDNYRETVATVPTSDWASSVVFDEFSESLYVHPMALRATSAGMQMANPEVKDVIYYTDDEPAVEALLQDNSVELVMGGNGFTAKDARIDAATDWSYDISMKNEAGTSEILTTLAKGSPYAYYRFTNVTPTLSLGSGATNLTIENNGGNNLLVSVTEGYSGKGKTHYYGVYAPAGTTWTNAAGKLTADLPDGKNWITVAVLPDKAAETFSTYGQYAANRISDTVVEWEYTEAESLVTTVYNFETTNMDTGVTGGDTIICLYPHQWRYASNTIFAGYTYQTIRGNMLTTIGTKYTTNMTYNGILPSMPAPVSEEGLGTLQNQISYWWDYYQNTMNGVWTEAGDWQYGGYDTYWMGKNFNKRADMVYLAEQIDDDSEEWANIKEDIYTALKSDLQYWFNPADCYTPDAPKDPYITGFFYYYDDFGTLIGYNSSYSSDSELNDHHFHYGYWVKAAAAVAEYYKQYKSEEEAEKWEQEWGALVYEMISDYANPNRDGSSLNTQRTDIPADSPAKNTDTKYPFLRNFDIYEGHSWASGVANYEYDANGNMIDAKGGLSGGNNQESTSEAVNAWSSLILWGETVEDDRIRDLGIWLYTTEVAAVEEYYFDMYDEVFTDAYKDTLGFDQHVATRLFGGRYDHTAWWTDDPIEVTTIHMIPMTGSTLYFSKFPQKIKDTYNSIWGKQWDNYIAKHTQNGWQTLTSKTTHHDLLGEFYAMAGSDEAEYAMTNIWSIGDVNGQTVIETGESRAHTYGFIQSIAEFGAPDYETIGSQPLSMVFKKTDGTKTYVAQNLTDTDMTVYFSDGKCIDVPADSYVSTAEAREGENPELRAKVEYKLETYLQTIESVGEDVKAYEKVETVEKGNECKDGETFTLTPAEIDGFTFDEENANNVLSGVLVAGEDGAVTLKVYYDRNTYSISYETNDGENAEGNPESYVFGTSVTVNDPTRDGYRFLGWYTDISLTQPFTGITTETFGDFTLYASWISETAASYTTKVYKQNTALNGYVEVEKHTVIGEIGEIANFTYEGDTTGFTFNNEKSVTSGTIVEDGSLVLTVYYDRNKYDITYGNMEGVTNAHGNADSYVYGVGLTFVAPEKENYSFMGWFSDAGCTPGNEVTEVSDTQTGEVTVYAKWTEAPEESGGGVDTNITRDDIEVSYNGTNVTITLKNQTGLNEVITYIAKYDNEQSAKQACETATSALPGINLPGHEGVRLTVSGDKTSASGTWGIPVPSGNYIVFGLNINGAINASSAFYYYQVGAVPTASYTVNHLKQNEDLQTYSLAETSTKNGNLGAVVSESAKEYTGFTYNDSVSKTSGTVLSDDSLSLNLYYDRETYAIIYNNMTGVTNPNPATYSHGVGLVLQDPYMEGNTFLGWYTDSEFTQKISAIPTDSTGPVTLYAKWETGIQDVADVNYTVRYFAQNTTLGGYDELTDRTVNATAKLGSTVTAEIFELTGFTHNTSIGPWSATATEGLELKVYYDRNKYNITYHNVEGATNPNEETYAYGVGLTLKEASKAGWDFMGWYSDAEFENEITAIPTTQTGTVDVYAKWQERVGAVNYTVQYYIENTAQNGYIELTDMKLTKTAMEGDVVTAPTPTMTGFTLNPDAPGYKIEGEAAEGLELKVYYDRDEYNITYIGVTDAVNPNPATYVYGVGVTLKTPSKDGYSFGGWYTTATFDADSRITQIGTEETGNKMIYANWVDEVYAAQYTVEYYLQDINCEDYNKVEEDSVTSYGEVGQTANAFVRAYRGFACNEEISTLSGVVRQDNSLTLQVYYDRNSYAIHYENMEGASFTDDQYPTSYTFGLGATLPDAYKENYTFTGWYTDRNFDETTKITSISSSAATDVTVYAKWIPARAEYKVLYYLQDKNLDGYETIFADAETFMGNTDEEVTATVKEYTGFTYNESISEATGFVSADGNLELKLYYDRNTYAVHYENMEDAINHTANKNRYAYDVPMTLEAPEKSGFKFAGWYTDEACTEENKITEISAGTVGEVTVYAKWIDESNARNYKIEYYLQTVETAGSDTPAYEKAAEAEIAGAVGQTVSVPAKEFEGFEKVTTADSLESATIPADGTVTLKAFYNRKAYAIHYSLPTGEEILNESPVRYYYGVETELKAPSRKDYKFDGWYTTDTFTEETLIESIPAGTVGEVTLFAKWISKAALTWTVEQIPDQIFTGKKITPVVVVRDKDTNHKLNLKKDYTVKYSNNTNAGVATIQITGKGNYAGTRYINFNILPISLEENEAVTTDTIYQFTNNGKAVKVKPVVKVNGKAIKLNKDYKIDTSFEGSQTSYTEAGTYEVVLTGVDNYEGSVTTKVVMTDKASTILISKAKVTGLVSKVPYEEGKEEYKQNLTLTYKDKKLGTINLVEGTHYKLEYRNNKQTGSAEVIIHGLPMGEDVKFTGSKVMKYNIVGQKLTAKNIVLPPETYTYRGYAIEPAVAVVDNNGNSVDTKHYTVSYSNNVDKGKATVTVTGKNGWQGSAKKTFAISPMNLASDAITINVVNETTYVKGGATTSVEVIHNGEVLSPNVDYTLKYSNNKKLGQATVNVVGAGNYTGSVPKPFTVKEAPLSDVTLIVPDINFKANQKMKYYFAKVNVLDKDGNALKAGTDYNKVFTYEMQQPDGTFVSVTDASDAGTVAPGTVFKVTVKEVAGAPYVGSNSVTYRVIGAAQSISAAKVTIAPQIYNGRAVEISKADITSVQVKKNGSWVKLNPEDYEIIEGSYKNNVKKGTAKVTIKGVGEYGGIKEASFKITSKNMGDTFFLGRLFEWLFG